MKMNFENKVTDDDEYLIGLLKEQSLDFSSVELIEKTIVRLHAQQAEKTSRYVPLKTPIYMMIGIVLLLLIPFFFPTHSINSVFHFGVLTHLTNEFLSYGVMSWLVIVLCWVIKLVLSPQSKLNTNPQ